MLVPSVSHAQFNTYNQAGPPGSNQSNNNSNNNENSEEYVKKKPSYTLGRYFKSLAHKDSVDITRLTIGDMILPGTSQIYNRDYWKLPIVYGTLGGCIGGAVYSNVKYQSTGKKSYKNSRDIFVAGAVLSYWGQLIDGITSYSSYSNSTPAKSSLYSALLPGLGQAKNGDYWKIPIFYGGFAISGYCWAYNQKQYKRYKDLYIQAATEGGGYTGHQTADNLKWYRDSFRRLRDYSVVATALIYVLNIVDASVFAHFGDFDVNDDISLNIQPGFIEPVNTLNLSNSPGNSYIAGWSCPQAVGVRLNFNF